MTIRPVPFTQVKIEDRFWAPRQETNRSVTAPHSLDMLEKYGNIEDLDLAAQGARKGYLGLRFTDSDLYKVIEGVACTLATHPDPQLDKRLDDVIEKIAAAQMADGYLNTWYQVTKPVEDRWTNLRDDHELYCFGHMVEAAVAHFEATGKRNLLDPTLKFAEHVWERFGPEPPLTSGGEGAGGEGRIPGYCGHPEPELALVKLWRATDDRRWFELAELMVERRGSHYLGTEHETPDYDGTYWLDDVPIREHTEIKGHAVRAAYLMAGAADIALETGDEGIIQMLEILWRNVTEKRLYVTGGIGPSAANEGFTVDYDLPNLTAYQETCASIAMAFWGHRMFLLTGEARYMDTVEMALYNGTLSGISLDGKGFFYVNPLASNGDHHRVEWYECACCPPNVLRLIAPVGGYAYAASDDSLYVNLYIAGSVRAQIGSQEVELNVTTDYPWDGKVEVEVGTSGRFAIGLRVPGWCEVFDVCLNDGPSGAVLRWQGYMMLDREWSQGDKIILQMEMPANQLETHPAVCANAGRLAIQRGPLIYCAEQVDNVTTPLDEFVVPAGSSMDCKFRNDVLGGTVVIEANAQRHLSGDWWPGELYRQVSIADRPTITLVPYCLWGNREAGPMEVWLRSSPAVPPATGATHEPTIDRELNVP